MLKKLCTCTLLTITLSWAVGWSDIAWADGPYRGKVVDAETKEPIEGAVVVAVWTRRVFRIVENKTVFADAKEVLTDKNGEFEIPGYTRGKVGRNYLEKLFGLQHFGINEPAFYILKPSYGSYPRNHLSPKENFKTHFRPYSLVLLPKLVTRKQRLDVLHTTSIYEPDVPDDKVQYWKSLIRIERANLGLEP